MLNTWQLYKNNRSYPSWWKVFKTDWRKCLDAERLESYHVDVDKWICSCPASIDNPYLMCKHLIQTYAASNPDIPQYKTTIRRHDYIQQSSSNEPETIPEISGEGGLSGSSIRARFDTIEIERPC